MKKTLSILMLASAVMLAACGGGGGSSDSSSSSSSNSSNSSNGSGGSTTTTSTSTTNTVPVQVSQVYSGGDNMPYVSVTICAPNSTNCATINNVLLDTGSQGLRLAASAVPSGLLSAEKDSNGNTYAECAQFASGVTWGTLASADIKMGGEVASNQAVQIIGGGSASIPSDCSSAGTPMDTTAELYGNGILGVGSFADDCGTACASQALSAAYYTCSGSTCTNAAVPVAAQVQNPVYNFAQDNNGVVLALGAVPATGATTATGTLTFGIGTQSNNTLTAQNVIAADPTYAEFTTNYNGKSYASFLDSGSNYLFFSDSSIAQCTGSLSGDGFYCPTSALSLSATATAYGGQTSASIPFTIDNASNLFSTSSYSAFDNVGVDAALFSSATFDWGLPFFYGKTVFVGIDGRSANGTAGPFFAW